MNKDNQVIKNYLPILMAAGLMNPLGKSQRRVWGAPIIKTDSATTKLRQKRKRKKKISVASKRRNR